MDLHALRLGGGSGGHRMRMASSDDVAAGPGGPRDLASTLAGCQGPHALILLDLDGFGAYNLTSGYDRGDERLRDVGAVLADRAEEGRVLHLTSDEFAVVVPCAGPDEAIGVAASLAAALAAMSPAVSACFGAVMLVEQDARDGMVGTAGVDVDRTVQHAGLALLAARRSGAGTVGGLLAEHVAAVERGPANVSALADDTEHAGIDVRAALRLERFELHFQPLVVPATSHPTGLEALIRCHGRDAQVVGADAIMPLVRRARMSVEFGSFVIERALAQWAEALATAVRAAGGPRAVAPLLSVNIDIEQVRQEGFEELVLHLLRRAAVPPAELVIEVAEPVLADPAAVERLRTLRAAGVKVAVDDFGAGPVVLSEIRDLPVDIIKVDQVLVGRLDPLAPDMNLIADLQRLTTLLGLSLVVEAVETPILAHRIAGLGVPLAQGFHYAPPMPSRSVVDWLSAQGQPGAATPGAGGA